MCRPKRTRETANSTVEFVWVAVGNKDDIIGKLQRPHAGNRRYRHFSECGAYNATYSPVNFLGLPSQEYLLLDSSRNSKLIGDHSRRRSLELPVTK